MSKKIKKSLKSSNYLKIYFLIYNMNSHIGIVVNYSSLEKNFIDGLLKECNLITSNIVISYGSHLYNGIKEDSDEYLKFYKEKYPNNFFIKYDVNLNEDLFKNKGVNKRPTAYWCNLARWNGYLKLKNNVEWIIFIDADEIPDSNLFNEWLNENTLHNNYNYKFANYWYFKTYKNQSLQFEDSILMVNKNIINEDNIFHDDERDGILKMTPNIKQFRMVKNKNNMPMWHHFSWVRNKQGIINKLKNFTHRDDLFKDENVAEKIAEYIYRDDNINDIIHNYQYKLVDNIFGILE